ncbi:MAG: tRNA-dihydrouridine synthase, partial [Endomicrobiales bacterium]|nr:tRNA-dihydrouridine synthase [Endomicrobiales bacterium]
MNCKKILSSIVAFSFLLTSFPAGGFDAAKERAAESREIGSLLGGFFMPPSVAKISDIDLSGQAGTLVINIQDLHCNPEVQKNISKILQILNEKQELGEVYVEGASGGVSTAWLEGIADEKMKYDVLESLIAEGRLTGAEYYSAVSGKPELLKGLENERLYKANFSRLTEIIESDKQVSRILEEVQNDVDFLKKTYLSGKQNRIERLISDYRKGNVNAKKYFTLLGKYSAKLGAGFNEYVSVKAYVKCAEDTEKLDYKKISKELTELVSVLKQKVPYRVFNAVIQEVNSSSKDTGRFYSLIGGLARKYDVELGRKYPEFVRLCAVQDADAAINPVTLLKEEKKLEKEVRYALCENETQREIAFLSDYSDVLKDYFTNSINPEDYEYFNSKLGDFKRTWLKYRSGKNLDELNRYFGLFKGFYEANVRRNGVFVENIKYLKASGGLKPKKESEREISGTQLSNRISNSRVVVVITGGFHSKGLADILKDRGVPYVIITPNVSSEVSFAQKTYRKIALEQAKVLKNAYALLLLSQNPADYQARVAVGAVLENLLAANRTVEDIETIINGKILSNINRESGLDSVFHIVKKADGYSFTISVRRGAAVETRAYNYYPGRPSGLKVEPASGQDFASTEPEAKKRFNEMASTLPVEVLKGLLRDYQRLLNSYLPQTGADVSERILPDSKAKLRTGIFNFTPAGSRRLVFSCQPSLTREGEFEHINKWTIQRHIEEIKGIYGPDAKILAYTGNGNGGYLSRHIIYADGRFHYRVEEPIGDRNYSAFAGFRDGSRRIIDVKIRDERIIDLENEQDITDELSWLVSGERITRNGKPVDWRKDESFEGYSDPRHLFQFPYSLYNKDPKSGKDVFRNILWFDAVKKAKALRGEFINLPLSNFAEYGYKTPEGRADIEYIRAELLGDVYTEEDFYFTDTDLVILLKPGRYQHKTVGTTRTGSVKVFAVSSDDRQAGITFDELCERSADAGLSDSILLDNGGDVLVWTAEGTNIDSLAKREIFASMLFLVDIPAEEEPAKETGGATGTGVKVVFGGESIQDCVLMAGGKSYRHEKYFEPSKYGYGDSGHVFVDDSGKERLFIKPSKGNKYDMFFRMFEGMRTNIDLETVPRYSSYPNIGSFIYDGRTMLVYGSIFLAKPAHEDSAPHLSYFVFDTPYLTHYVKPEAETLASIFRYGIVPSDISELGTGDDLHPIYTSFELHHENSMPRTNKSFQIVIDPEKGYSDTFQAGYLESSFAGKDLHGIRTKFLPKEEYLKLTRAWKGEIQGDIVDPSRFRCIVLNMNEDERGRFLEEWKWLVKEGFVFDLPMYDGRTGLIVHSPVPLVEHTFTYKPVKTETQVFVAGSFNAWQPGTLRMKWAADEGVYRLTVKLPEGQNKYKFIVDGEWVDDKSVYASEDDGLGGRNSLVYIEKPDIMRITAIAARNLPETAKRVGGQIAKSTQEQLRLFLGQGETTVLTVPKEEIRTASVSDSQVRPFAAHSANQVIGPLKLNEDDVYAELAGGPGTAAVAASCKVKDSVYVDIAGQNIPIVTKLAEHANDPFVLDYLLFGSGGKNIQQYLETIRDRRKHPAQNLRIIQGDIRSLPMDSDSVTKVSLINTFVWLDADGVNKCLEEILRVTRAGGLMHIKHDIPALAKGFKEKFVRFAADRGVELAAVEDTEIGGTVYEVRYKGMKTFAITDPQELLDILEIKDPLEGQTIYGRAIDVFCKQHGLFLPYPMRRETFEQREFDSLMSGARSWTLKAVEDYINAYAARMTNEKDRAQLEKWVQDLKRAARKQGAPQVKSLITRTGPLAWAGEGNIFRAEQVARAGRLFGSVDISGMALKDLPFIPVDDKGDVRMDLLLWLTKTGKDGIPPEEYYSAKKVPLSRLPELKSPKPAPPVQLELFPYKMTFADYHRQALGFRYEQLIKMVFKYLLSTVSGPASVDRLQDMAKRIAARMFIDTVTIHEEAPHYLPNADVVPFIPLASKIRMAVLEYAGQSGGKLTLPRPDKLEVKVVKGEFFIVGEDRGGLGYASVSIENGRNVFYVTEGFLKKLLERAPPEQDALVEELVAHEMDEYLYLKDRLQEKYFDYHELTEGKYPNIFRFAEEAVAAYIESENIVKSILGTKDFAIEPAEIETPYRTRLPAGGTLEERYIAAQEVLSSIGQEGLLEDWDVLSNRQRDRLLSDIEQVDWRLFDELMSSAHSSAGKQRPKNFRFIEPKNPDIAGQDVIKAGRDVLTAGANEDPGLDTAKYGCLVVCGGTGSGVRGAEGLSDDDPKGFMKIAPLSGETMYQSIVKEVAAAAKAYGHSKTYPIGFMVSRRTKEKTIRYLQALEEWDEIKDRVIFVEQMHLPVIGSKTREVVMASPYELALSGAGHGDAFDYALNPEAGVRGITWSEDEGRFIETDVVRWYKGFGVENVQYMDVDNPLKPVADEVILGYHATTRDPASERSGRAHITLALVKKTQWDEERRTFTDRLGNVVVVNGGKESIDYGDASDAVNASPYGDPSIRVVTLDSLKGSKETPWTLVKNKGDAAFVYHKWFVGLLEGGRTRPAAGFLMRHAPLDLCANKQLIGVDKFERSSGNKKRYGVEIGYDADDVFAPVKKAEDIPIAKEKQSNYWKRLVEQVFPGLKIPGFVMLELPKSAKFMRPDELKQKLSDLDFIGRIDRLAEAGGGLLVKETAGQWTAEELPGTDAERSSFADARDAETADGFIGEYESVKVERFKENPDGLVHITLIAKRRYSSKIETIFLSGHRAPADYLNQDMLFVDREPGSNVFRAIGDYLASKPQIDDIILDECFVLIGPKTVDLGYRSGRGYEGVDLLPSEFGGIGIADGPNGKPLRAIRRELYESPVARFHEIAHIANSLGLLPTHRVLSEVTNKDICRRMYDQKIDDNDSEPIKFHYAIRAFQSEHLQAEDEALTKTIRKYIILFGEVVDANKLKEFWDKYGEIGNSREIIQYVGMVEYVVDRISWMLDRGIPVKEMLLAEVIGGQWEARPNKGEVILASPPSPRNYIMREIFENVTRVTPQVEELGRKGLSYENSAMVSALAKALYVLEQGGAGVVVGMDTIISDSHGPVPRIETEQEAVEKLRSYAGNRVSVVTGICIIDSESGKVTLDYGKTYVHFKKLNERVNKTKIRTIVESEPEKYGYLSPLLEKDRVTTSDIISAYAAEGKPLRQGGAFAIQDRDIFLVIDHVEGFPLTVVGLPDDLVLNMVQDYGVKRKRKIQDMERRYWPEQYERDKIHHENAKQLEARKISERDTKRVLGQTIDRLRLVRRSLDLQPEVESDLNAFMVYYLKLIEMSKTMYHFYDAVRFANIMIRRLERVQKAGGLTAETIRIMEQLKIITEKYKLNENGFDRRTWNSSTGPPLEEQTALHIALDRLGNIFFDWDRAVKETQIDMSRIKKAGDIEEDYLTFIYGSQRRHARSPVVDPSKPSKRYSIYESDSDGRFYHYDQDRRRKYELLKNGLNEFGEFMGGIDPRLMESADLWGNIAHTMNRIARGNIESDLSRGAGVQPKDTVVVDDRKELIDLMKAKMKEGGSKTPEVIVAMDNAGAEAFYVLWQVYLLLNLGFKVTLLGKSQPMLQSDATYLDIQLMIPYFNGFIREKFGADAPLLSDYLNKGLAIDAADNRADLKKAVKKQKPEYVMLIGEMWYGHLVGINELREPPFTADVNIKDTYVVQEKKGQSDVYDKTVVFSVHTHKNHRQKLAVLVDTFEGSDSWQAPSARTIGWQVYQIFKPQTWQKAYTEYKIKGCARLSELSDTAKGELKKKLVTVCRTRAANKEDERNADQYDFKENWISEDEVEYTYSSPVKYVKIHIKPDRLIVTIKVDYGPEKMRVHQGIWDTVATKIPCSARDVLMENKFLNKHGTGSILTDAEEKIVIEDVEILDTEGITAFKPRSMVLDVSLPVGSIGGKLNEGFKLDEYYVNPEMVGEPGSIKGILWVQIVKRHDGGLGDVRSIVPARYDREKGTIDFLVTNPPGALQIAGVLAWHKDAGAEVVTLTTPDWYVDLRDEEHLARERSGKITFERKKFDPSMLPKVLPGPVDNETMYPKRVLLAQDCGVQIAYSDLMKVGNIYTQVHVYNKRYYWSDVMFRSGLPRLDISSNESHTAIQLSGPHSIPEHLNVLGLFDSGDQKIVDAYVIAAKLAVLNGATSIDINTGCPSLEQFGGGPALYNRQALLEKIIREIKKAVGEDVPVSVKMRLLQEEDENKVLVPSDKKTSEFVNRVVDAGASWVVIHTRTKNEQFDTVKPRDARTKWPLLAYIKREAPERTYIFGNGQVSTIDDAAGMIKASESGAEGGGVAIDGVMVASKMLTDPLVIPRIENFLRNGTRPSDPTYSEKLKVVLKNLSYESWLWIASVEVFYALISVVAGRYTSYFPTKDKKLSAPKTIEELAIKQVADAVSSSREENDEAEVVKIGEVVEDMLTGESSKNHRFNFTDEQIARLRDLTRPEETADGCIGKFERVSVSEFREYPEGRVAMVVTVLPIGAAHEEDIVIYGRRAPPSFLKEDLEFLDSQKPVVRVAFARLQKFLSEDPQLDDIIFDRAEFVTGSRLVPEDLLGLGLGPGPHNARPMRVLHESIANDPVARFHELAHIMNALWKISVPDIQSFVTGVDEDIYQKLYLDKIGPGSPESVKFHYILRAFQRLYFTDEDRALTGTIKRERVESRHERAQVGPVYQINALAYGAKRGEDGSIIPGTAELLLEEIDGIGGKYKDVYLVGLLPVGDLVTRMSRGERIGNDAETPFYTLYEDEYNKVLKEDVGTGKSREGPAKKRLVIYQPWQGNIEFNGSPFAVFNDRGINPQWGKFTDLFRIRDRLARKGSRVYVDVVPNHIGIDNLWLKENWGDTIHIKLSRTLGEELEQIDDEDFFNEQRLRELGVYDRLHRALKRHGMDLNPDNHHFFVYYTVPGDRSSRILIAHGRDPNFEGWVDTAQLDYSKETVRRYILDTIRFWAKMGINVRLDMLNLLDREAFRKLWHPESTAFYEHWPRDIYEEVSEILDEYPRLVIIAEAYGDIVEYLRELHPRFVVFNKGIRDSIVQGDVQAVRRYLMSPTSQMERDVHFLATHDINEPNAWSRGKDFIKAALALYATIPGVFYLHYRTAQGLDQMPIQQLVDKTGVSADEEMQKWCGSLVAKTALAEIKRGDLYVCDTSNPNLLAYARKLGHRRTLVVINITNAPQKGHVFLPPDWKTQLPRNYVFADVFYELKRPETKGRSGVEPEYVYPGSEIARNGIYIELDPEDAHIFKISEQFSIKKILQEAAGGLEPVVHVTAYGEGIEKLINGLINDSAPMNALLGRFLLRPSVSLARKLVKSGMLGVSEGGAAERIRIAMALAIENREKGLFSGVEGSPRTILQVVEMEDPALIKDPKSCMLASLGVETNKMFTGNEQKFMFIAHGALLRYIERLIDTGTVPGGFGSVDEFIQTLVEHELDEYLALNGAEGPEFADFRFTAKRDNFSVSAEAFHHYIELVSGSEASGKLEDYAQDHEVDIGRLRSIAKQEKLLRLLPEILASAKAKEPALKTGYYETVDFPEERKILEDIVSAYKDNHPGESGQMIREAFSVAAKLNGRDKADFEIRLQMAKDVASWKGSDLAVAAALLSGVNLGAAPARNVLRETSLLNKRLDKVKSAIAAYEKIDLEVPYVDGKTIPKIKGDRTIQNYIGMVVKMTRGNPDAMLLLMAGKLRSLIRIKDERERRARFLEIQHIYVPFCMSMAQYGISEVLRDESLRLFDPYEYQRVKSAVERLIGMKYGEAKNALETMRKRLLSQLANEGVSGDVTARLKGICSIWEKITSSREALYFEVVSLKDIFGMSVVVSEQQLSKARDVVDNWLFSKGGKAFTEIVKESQYGELEKGFDRIKYNFNVADEKGHLPFELCVYDKANFNKYLGMRDEASQFRAMPHWVYKYGKPVMREGDRFVVEIEFPKDSGKAAETANQTFIASDLVFT